MKAVFVHCNSLLRDSHIDPETPIETWRLVPATLEAMRTLATNDTLLFLYGPDDGASQEGDGARAMAGLRHLASEIEAGGGRVDGLILCTRQSIAAKRCYGEFPGLIWVPTVRFNLRPETCYLIGDSFIDVQTALSAGVRPLILLGGRSIEEVFGRVEIEKNFPMAMDLTAAVSYIQVEEEITQQLLRPRQEAPPVPTALQLVPLARDLPTLTVISRKAQEIEASLSRTRIRRSDIMRWLFILSLGGLGLSLGVAYLLTHLYRVQPFPSFMYYVTLQFISRPLRGTMFVLVGITLIVLAFRRLLRDTRLGEWLNNLGR